jgi:hypothetical protein
MFGMGRATRYALGALMLATVTVAVSAGAAAAHPPGQQASPDTPYYRAEITGVMPTTAGVTARVDPGGEWIEVANAGPATVVVLGYTGEPYLRIASGSADENEASPTTYLNHALFADTVPSEQLGATGPPTWKQIGATGTARWHDHRIHWMGRDRPPAVAADPTRPHPVGTWAVHATADGMPFDVRGALTWVGKPARSPSGTSSPPWLLTLLAGLTGVVGVLVVALVRARRRPAPARAGRTGRESARRAGHGSGGLRGHDRSAMTAREARR